MKKLSILVVPGLAKHNLTVAKNKVTVKLRAEADEKERNAASAFLEKVGQVVDSPKTVRGRLSVSADGYMSIRLETGDKELFANYSTKDFP